VAHEIFVFEFWAFVPYCMNPRCAHNGARLFTAPWRVHVLWMF